MTDRSRPSSRSRSGEVESLLSDINGLRLTRRQVLRRGTMLGLSLPIVGGLLAACGGDDDDDDDGSAGTTPTTSTSAETASPTAAKAPARAIESHGRT